MPQNDRIGIDKFRAAFDAVKTDERAASDEGYDAVIASTIDIEFIRDIIEDEAIHHAALTLPLDKRLHKLSTSNRKLLEEKRLLGALIERLDGYIADPELLYREEILAAAHTGEALERALGTWQHVDPFAYPSVDYDPVKRKLLTMCHKQTSTEKGHVELVAELRPMLEADCSNVVAHGCNLFCAFREFGALDDKKRSVLLEGSARELLGWVTEESALGRIAVTSKRNRGLVGQERRSRLTPSAAGSTTARWATRTTTRRRRRPRRRRPSRRRWPRGGALHPPRWRRCALWTPMMRAVRSSRTKRARSGFSS